MFNFTQLLIAAITIVVLLKWCNHCKTPESFEGKLVDLGQQQASSLGYGDTSKASEVFKPTFTVDPTACPMCMIDALGHMMSETKITPLHKAALENCKEIIENQTLDWKMTIPKRLQRMGLHLSLNNCVHQNYKQPQRKVLLPESASRIPSEWNSPSWQNWTSDKPY